MSSFVPIVMLCDIQGEEKSFMKEHGRPPEINELSPGLQAQIHEHITPTVISGGLESIKSFLKQF